MEIIKHLKLVVMKIQHITLGTQLKKRLRGKSEPLTCILENKKTKLMSWELSSRS